MKRNAAYIGVLFAGLLASCGGGGGSDNPSGGNPGTTNAGGVSNPGVDFPAGLLVSLGDSTCAYHLNGDVTEVEKCSG